jgi:hypothetical protein
MMDAVWAVHLRFSGIALAPLPPVSGTAWRAETG